MAFTVSEVISRPIDEVWSELTNWEQAPQWMKGIESMTASGPTQAGTTLTFHTRGKDRLSEIAQCEVGRRVLLRSTQGGVTADYEYALESVDDKTTSVTLSAKCTTKGIGWGIVSPLLRVAVRLADGGQIKALKTMLEAPSPSG